jgi:YHS domain-containing protein
MKQTTVLSQTFDPVCGVRVDGSTAKGGACMQGGLVHYFCSFRCKSRFLLEPEAYAKGGARMLGQSQSGE